MRPGEVWLRFLFWASYVITVVMDAAALAVVWPAFKRTRNRGFLLIAFAFALGIFTTVCDHTLATTRMSQLEWIFYRTIRRLSYFGDIICISVGVIFVTRSYLAQFVEPKSSNQSLQPTADRLGNRENEIRK